MGNKEQIQVKGAESFKRPRKEFKKNRGLRSLTAGLILAGSLHGVPLNQQQSQYERPTTSISVAPALTSGEEITPTLHFENRTHILADALHFSPYSEELFQQNLVGEDIWKLGKLQRAFDKVIGRNYDAKDMLTRSYNPVIDRWHIEKLRSEGNSVGESGYKNEMRKNIETNLRERLQVSENVIRYHIKGNELYSQDFPDEPFSEVLRRGVEYRLAHGTPEAERESSELEGWEKIQQKFTDPNTPIGTKMTVFSPPGRVKDTAYDRQLVDEYKLMEDESGRFLQVTRKIVDFNDSDYIGHATSLNPNFFDNHDGRPLDAWFLANPLEGSLPLLEMNGKMDSATFEKIYDNRLLQGMVEKFIESVTAENVDWREVAMDINAIYNQMDAQEKAFLNKGSFEQPVYVTQEAISTAVQKLGMITPEEKGGAGCPTSKGYSLSNSLTPSSNSVSRFSKQGGSMMGTCPEIKCKNCPWKASESEAKSVRSGSLTACPQCGWVPGGSAPKREDFAEAA